ncbi:hypothetical protein [Capsulimonas corticalis]|uniref:hypothetical protein n=1 Tax=Capsulimonas corticalis TaxID=2219043 RepID=UPI000E64BE7F|nr:hypothetical protein [Capsulimonas corticalis]
MSDPNAVWPPPSTNEPPISLPPNHVRSAIISLTCFITYIFLVFAWIVTTSLGETSMGVRPSVVELGSLMVMFAGIGFGIRGWRHWQGKIGLIGSSLLLFAFVVLMVYFV